MWFELQARLDPEIRDTARTPTLLFIIFPPRPPVCVSLVIMAASLAVSRALQLTLVSHPRTPALRGKESISAQCVQAQSVVHSIWNWFGLHACRPDPVTKWAV